MCVLLVHAVDVHRREPMKLYLKVTTDKYELPLVVADSQSELARMLGIQPNAIHKQMHFARTGKWKWCQYREVEIDDERKDIQSADE